MAPLVTLYLIGALCILYYYIQEHKDLRSGIIVAIFYPVLILANTIRNLAEKLDR